MSGGYFYACQAEPGWDGMRETRDSYAIVMPMGSTGLLPLRKKK